ncbi:hypothetical protein [Methylocystis sp.]|uniref:hypothetical protein n=1 Tax=Methylocystis sp. TaxID=1911079 RepID=UPI003D0C5309
MINLIEELKRKRDLHCIGGAEVAIPASASNTGERGTMPTSSITVERAFFLARSGACSSLADIIARLDREGYGGRQIYWRVLTKQLRDLINQGE